MTATYRTVDVRLGKENLQIEFGWLNAQRQDRPLIVFLHEGLGSAAMWGPWPDEFCRVTGCRGLLYSRPSYGRSGTGKAAWTEDYLEQEAAEVLPALLRTLQVDPVRQPVILFGHSDGASIALLHAARFPETPAATIAVAPHVFVEQTTLNGIADLSLDYTARLRRNLARYHPDPDRVFNGWSQRWLSPYFRHWDITRTLPSIRCPLLLIQGVNDQFGTFDQLHAIRRQVPHAEVRALEECGHIPHREQPQLLLQHCRAFLQRVMG